MKFLYLHTEEVAKEGSQILVTMNPSNEIMKQPLSKIKFAASMPKLYVTSGFVCSIMRTCNSAWRIVPLSKDWNVSTLVHAWWEDGTHTWSPSFVGIYKMSKLKIHNCGCRYRAIQKSRQIYWLRIGFFNEAHTNPSRNNQFHRTLAKFLPPL